MTIDNRVAALTKGGCARRFPQPRFTWQPVAGHIGQYYFFAGVRSRRWFFSVALRTKARP